jgi:hypothetical protein
MNVFILNAGRCGSSTFIQACRHIENYSAAHESRIHEIADKRLAYPDRHIEADNRLSWLLGRLQDRFSGQAFYVHLTRNREAMRASFVKRAECGIMKAYKEGVLLGGQQGQSAQDIADDYLDTIDGNIRLFLKDKPHKMAFALENAKEDFRTFWRLIDAEGDLQKALAEWDVRYNASVPAAKS